MLKSREPHPGVLTLQGRIVGRRLEFDYETDNHDLGTVAVEYPFEPTIPPAGLGAIALVVGVYLGSLSLARRLIVRNEVPVGAVEAIMPLAEMLYEIRRWKDALDSGSPPEVSSGTAHAAPLGLRHRDGGRRALLLWSGGKDSTLSKLLLSANGYDVEAVHFTANAGVERREFVATERLSARLGLTPCRVGYAHPQFVDFSTGYAVNWNRRPLCNTVPFGRDMLLASLAQVVAHHSSSEFVSLGHDHECRVSTVRFGGRDVPRNDVESLEGALALDRYLHEFVFEGARLLPPLAGISELRILHAMLVGNPELMAQTSFCFWGENCGRCAKCLRYFLAQRLFGVEVLSFAVNPLSEGGAPELDDILDVSAVGILFQSQVLLCMARLHERGDVRPGESSLARFGEAKYSLVAPELSVWERKLLTVGEDVQLPKTWSYATLPGATAMLNDSRAPA